ncbi:MAG: hypothetical protein K2Q22_06665, partial [Cytophagales bacterium]|nr:hypothetical protein [Cytophagales bacterium]
MKPTTIEHSLRTITLEYNDKQDLSPLESKALEVYVGLHGTLDSLKKRLSKLNGRLFKLELDIKKCKEDRLALEQEVRKTGPVAGYSYEECLSFEIPEDTEIEL